MKRVLIAAVAVFALAPAFAADAPASTTATTMTADQCKAAMDKCGTDAKCQAALVSQGCTAPAAPAAPATGN